MDALVWYYRKVASVTPPQPVSRLIVWLGPNNLTKPLIGGAIDRYRLGGVVSEGEVNRFPEQPNNIRLPNHVPPRTIFDYDGSISCCQRLRQQAPRLRTKLGWHCKIDLFLI